MLAEKARQQRILNDEAHRGTGRTTRMLEEVADCGEDSFVIFHSQDAANHAADRFLGICRNKGMTPTRKSQSEIQIGEYEVKFACPSDNRKGYRRRLFWDHHALAAI